MKLLRLGGYFQTSGVTETNDTTTKLPLPALPTAKIIHPQHNEPHAAYSRLCVSLRAMAPGLAAVRTDGQSAIQMQFLRHFNLVLAFGVRFDILSLPFPPTAPDMEQKLTLAEIAEIYRVSTKTFSRIVRAKKIPHDVVGRRLLFDLSVVKPFMRAEEPVANKPARHISSRTIKPVSKYAEALGL